MKCSLCNTEMIVDHSEEKGDTEVFYYKCPNPQCVNFGYKEAENKQDVEPK